MFKYNPDNKVMLFLAKCADVGLATFLWLCFCVPIVTVGASTCALYTVLWRIHAGREVRVIREFLQAMKVNFKVSTITWIFSVIAGALILGNVYACSLMEGSTGLFGMMKGSLLCDFVYNYTVVLVPLYCEI